jgi:hypothetical protein
MRFRLILSFLAIAAVLSAQKYSGPRPPKPDLPYLKHAENLIPAEAAEAKEEQGKKDDITYTVAGAVSSARTPLAAPIFLMQYEKLNPESLQLFRLESRNGHREITMSPKKPGKPIRVSVTKLSSDGIYKLEVSESLEAGEYSFSPNGSNQVFCFQVF